MSDFIFCDSGVREAVLVICKNGVMVAEPIESGIEELAGMILSISKSLKIKDVYIDFRSYGLAVIDAIKSNSEYSEDLAIHKSDSSELWKCIRMIERIAFNKAV